MVNIDKYKSHVALTTPLYGDLSLAPRAGHPDPHVNPSKSQNATETRQQMVQAGQQFEAYFISYLLKVMRETVPEGALTNKQGAYFYSFYDEEIGKRAAESGGIGIAKMVREYAQQYSASSPLEHSSS
ncbi:MAG: rod-binding protein [Nitrospira sp.]